MFFICEKTNVNVTNEQTVGNAVAFANVANEIYTKTTWFTDSTLENPVADDVTVIAGEQTFYAKGEIEFTGEGTEDTPYQIANVTDLKKLQALVNDDKDSDVNHTAGVYFKQTDEIDMAGEVWAGIGHNNDGQRPGNPGPSGKWTGGNATFAGVYDGNGKTISNITFASNDYSGFFNTLSNATIKALTLDVDGMETDSTGGAGVLAGIVIGSTIQNVTVEGTLTNGGHNVAGLAIKAGMDTSFIDCTNNADIACLANKRASGMVAFSSGLTGNLTFTRCVNNGDICVKYNASTSYGIGGFLGTYSPAAHETTVTFTDCANNGAITRTEVPDEGDVTANIGTFIGVLDKGQSGSTYPYMPSIVATGCSAQADIASVGVCLKETAGAIDGLGFATFADDVATFVAPANDGTYNVMFAGAPLELANKGDSVTLTPTFGTPVVTTSADDCAVQVEGNVYTVVANLYAVTWDGSENVVVSNGAAQVEATSGSYETGTVLKFYATAGSITNVTVNGEAATVANPFEYTVNKAGATIVVLAGEDVKPLPPIDPTEPTDPMNEKDAEAAAAEINAHPEKYIKVPTEFGEIGEAALATYQTYFTAVVKGSGDNCTVALELNTAGQTALQNSVDTEIVKIKPADVAAGTADDVTITTIPGFYYGVKAGNGIGTMVIKSSVPGTGTELKLDLPQFTGSGFYTIVASPTPMTVVK